MALEQFEGFLMELRTDLHHFCSRISVNCMQYYTQDIIENYPRIGNWDSYQNFLNSVLNSGNVNFDGGITHQLQDVSRLLENLRFVVVNKLEDSNSQISQLQTQ